MTHSKQIDRINLIVAALVASIAFLVYNSTKAPTLSFWDCGEFIAATVALQIPHPPGSPFYIILGRVFSLLPIAADLAVRINLLSVVSSTFTVFFGYMAISHILRKTLTNDSSILSRLIRYGGASCSALFLAFAYTNWNNAVEAEVYGLSMMLTVAIFWMSLLYWDNKGSQMGERLLHLIFFTAFLGVSVHLSTYLIMPVLAIFVIVKKDVHQKFWYFFSTLFLFELYLIFAMSSRPNEVPYYIPLLLVFIIFLFYIFSFEKIIAHYVYVGIGFMIAVLPIVGDLLVNSDAQRFSSLSKTMYTIGYIGFALLIGFGLYLLFAYLKTKKSGSPNTHQLIAVLFVFVSSLMVLMLYPIHGYDAYVPFLLITAILGTVFLVAFAKDINWLNLIAVASVSLVIIGVKEFVFGMLGGALLIFVLAKTMRLPGWKNALLIILVSMVGYSTHMYIPIRSWENPKMNENNPGNSLQSTIDYIERKQYGSMSMTKRMFVRRAEWTNQFGNHRHMGFWGYFEEQYGLKGQMFIPLFMIGLFGVWEVIRRRASMGLPFLLILFISTVGLVLYMNFADGTRMRSGLDYLEVRDRDYFFTPAFIFFGLAIGTGFAFIIQYVREFFQKQMPAITKPIIFALSVLFLLPVYAYANNFNVVKRINNHIPFDYGWNLLTSADKDAVLFTVGDNDTFTLWCLQDVYGIRTDVAVVNLSLANTSWYIKQLQTNLGVNISWTEDQIDALRPFRDQKGNVYRLDAQVVSEIIKENFNKRPINFSVTVPESKWRFYDRSIDSLMALKGMMWRMTSEGGGPRVMVDSSIAFLSNPERMRLTGINDPAVYKDATTLRLTRNHAVTFMRVARPLIASGEHEKVQKLMERALKEIPHSTDAINFMAEYYVNNTMADSLKQLIETTEYGDKNHLMTKLGVLYYHDSNFTDAEKMFESVLEESPTYKPAFEELMRMYFARKEAIKMRELINVWLLHNPEDSKMKSLLQELEKEIQRFEAEGS